MEELFTGIGAFAACFAVSFTVYLISRAMLKSSKNNTLFALPLVRQVINVAVFVAGYFIGKAAGLPLIPLLIGSAVGLTLPNIAFTFKLSSDYAKNAHDGKIQKAQEENEDNEDNKKGGER